MKPIKILYAQGWNNKTKEKYNIYIYALVDLKTLEAKKISKDKYKKICQKMT